MFKHKVLISSIFYTLICGVSYFSVRKYEFDASRAFAISAFATGSCYLTIDWLLSRGVMRSIYARKEANRHIAGPHLVVPNTLLGKVKSGVSRILPTKEKQLSISIGGILVPRDVEPLHFCLVGGPGNGKSQTAKGMMKVGVARRDRMIVVDPNGEMLRHFWYPGCVILNPFDSRGWSWSIFDELTHVMHFLQVSSYVIGEGEGGEKEWNRYAIQLIAAVCKRLTETDDATVERLLHYLTKAGPKELGLLLQGEPIAQLLDKGSDKMFSCIRSLLALALNTWDFIDADGEFSMREWVKNGKGSVFITYGDSQWTFIAPLVRTWIQIAFSETLDLPEDESKRLWFFLDEVSSLGPVPNLEHALARLRKHGASIVLGMQSVAQLRAIYGHDNATAIMDCIGNWLVLATADPDTAEHMSRMLGEEKIEVKQITKTVGLEKSVSMTWRTEYQRVVHPSIFRNLKRREGFLCLKGDARIHRVIVPVVDLPVVANGYEEKPSLRLKPRSRGPQPV